MDFRHANPTVLKLGHYAKAVSRNIAIRDFLAELYDRLDVPAPAKLSSIDLDENPEQMAQAIRYELGIDEFQISADSKKDFFREFRKLIERLGIFVVQDQYISDSIDGLALFHANFTSNYILLNPSKRNSGRKSFTLAHELAHILGKRSALSDDYNSNNDVELYCNVFASSLLLPRNAVQEFSELQNLRFNSYSTALSSSIMIADYFNVSISAALVRVHQIGISDKNYYYEFAKSFGEDNHLDSMKQKQRGGPAEGPDQGVIAIAYLGQRAAALISSALERNVTSPMELCQRIGLSKKRTLRLAKIAKTEGYTFE